MWVRIAAGNIWPNRSVTLDNSVKTLKLSNIGIKTLER
jgi:hypothetical protein